MRNHGPTPHLKRCATLPTIPHWRRCAMLSRADLPHGQRCATLAFLKPDPAIPPLASNHVEIGQTPHWKCCAMAGAGIAPHRQSSATLARVTGAWRTLSFGERITGESAPGPRCAKSNYGKLAHSGRSGMEMKEIDAVTRPPAKSSG